MPARGKKKAKRSAGGRKRSAGKRAGARKGGARKGARKVARKATARKRTGSRKGARPAARKATARKASRPRAKAAMSRTPRASAPPAPLYNESPMEGAIELERDEISVGITDDMFAGAEDHDADADVGLPDDDLD